MLVLFDQLGNDIKSGTALKAETEEALKQAQDSLQHVVLCLLYFNIEIVIQESLQHIAALYLNVESLQYIVLYCSVQRRNEQAHHFASAGRPRGRQDRHGGGHREGIDAVAIFYPVHLFTSVHRVVDQEQRPNNSSTTLMVVYIT